MPKPPKAVPKRSKSEKNESLKSWIWDAACSIRGAKNAPKNKGFILPLIFTKHLCDIFADELNCIAAEVGLRKRTFQLAKGDHKLVRFFLPLHPADNEPPVWSVIRMLFSAIRTTCGIPCCASKNVGAAIGVEQLGLVPNIFGSLHDRGRVANKTGLPTRFPYDRTVTD